MSDEKAFTVADVRNTTGMSYRQMNEWDQKGALPNDREDDASWRKFSPKQIFVILVCNELRTRFNIPFDSLRYVRTFMMQENANHFEAAVRLMGMGFSVLLMTDFKSTFVMDTDLEVSDLFYLGMTRHEEPEAFAILKVNPLVNRLLGCFKDPVEFKIKDDIYNVIYEARGATTARSAKEREVLQLLRDGNYTKVSIELSNGKIVRADAESEHGCLSSEELSKLIEEDGFQTVTITKQNGKTVRVKRTKPQVIGRNRARQEAPESRVPTNKK